MSDRRQPPGEEVPSQSQTTSATASQLAMSTTDDPSDSRSTTLQSPSQGQLFRVRETPQNAPSESSRKAAKVAIPRLKKSLDASGEGPTRTGGRHRVTHACEPCRHRKTKCSGERPICRHCEDFKIACYYADGKRDRVKKQFGSMAEKVADYEQLLKDLASRVNDADAQLIHAALEKVSLSDASNYVSKADYTQETTYDVDDAPLDSVTLPSVEAVAEEDESGAESDASAGAGSTGALDRVEEDFTREGARDTGFMGKNSDVTWLRRLRQENRSGEDAQEGTQGMYTPGTYSGTSTTKPAGDSSSSLQQEGDGEYSVQKNSYHLDDLPITTFEHVDPYEVPTADTARNLFNAYITRVYPTFPIVGKINLTSQFHKFVSGQASRPPEKWLAILNLIFAIAAKYSHLVQADWMADERDHLIYFTRARLLSVNSELVFQHPDLQVIQIVGLTSFYFLCISQINRAWSMAGIAIRWATGLGLNVRNDGGSLRDPLKEIRYRVWWALYTLEHRLCSMTGRVCCILDEHCTTPLPVPLEEEKFESEEGSKLLSKEQQRGSRAPTITSRSPSTVSSSSESRSRSATKFTEAYSPSRATPNNASLPFARDVPPNSSLYFLHLVQLTRLSQDIFHRLYNPSTTQGTWSDVQDTIRHLSEMLEIWYRNLPSIFDFRRKQRDRDFYEFRLSLGFFYYGAKMTVHRPCLCRLDRKIPHQSSKSSDFNRQSATTCVGSARELLSLIPDEPNAVGLMRVGPWWSALHSLVQACSILALEISFRAHHMPEEADAILDASKKGIRWLHALGEDNLSAQRAWGLCNGMLHEAVRKIGRDVSDLPSRPPGRSPAEGTAGYGQSNSGMHNYSEPSSQGLTSTNMPSMYAPISNFDHFMRYDQYFPMDQSITERNMPTDVEMEFMSNAYHEGQDRGGGSGAGAGGDNGQQPFG